MSRRVLATALLGSLCLFSGATGLRAQTTFTWTGNGSPNNWDSSVNWAGGIAPADFTTDNVFFGDGHSSYVFLNSSDINAYGLTFSGNTQPFFLDGNFDGPSSLATLHLGTGGITYAPAQPLKSEINANFQLHDSQTWNIASGTLVLQGNIYDGDSDFIFTKTGAGTLVFGNTNNEFDASTINVNNGRLVLSASDPISGDLPLGWADLVIGPATGGNNPILVAADTQDNGGSVTLNNSLVLNGALTTENQTEFHLAGPVLLSLDTTINSKGKPLFIDGSISEPGSASGLTVNGTGAVILTGDNSYTGGTNVTNGVLIFGNENSIPNNLVGYTGGLLKAGANGYLGIAFVPTGDFYNATDILFLSHFDKANTHGTIGLDSDPNGATNTFTDNIDLSAVPTLTAFAPDARLGSATTAILSGTITPQGTDYRFGGGGGWLQVDSLLTGARAVVLDSPAALPLTVRLTNSSNDFSAGASVTNSALIFSYGPLTSGANSISINSGGYAGTEEFFELPSEITAFLGHIDPASVGMVGFDAAPGNFRGTISDPIDLSRFTNALYLGTATPGSEGPGLTLSGTITPAGGVSAPYRFAGYKGGALEVASPLTGGNGVLIGDPNSPGTFGDFINQRYSTVALTGDNSALTGNVTLYGGQLLVGQSNGTPGTDPTSALGSGTLVVTGMTLPAAWVGEDGQPPAPRFDTIVDGLILPNNISLGTTLQLGGNGNYFQLTGQITGSGGLYVEDGTEISLANDTNTFSGGIYLSSGSELDVDANHATGTGPLTFGFSSSSKVVFDTPAPSIHGLVSNQSFDFTSLFFEQSGAVLTIDQSVTSSFSGEFRSDMSPDDSYRIVKTGPGTLDLTTGGLYGYHGTPEVALDGTPVSVQVNQGTLIISNNFYLESGDQTFWVHGGTLALDGGKYVHNPIVVDNGGRLAGTGDFDSSIHVGTGATLAPGLANQGGIGTLTIAEVLAAPGGTYEWNLQSSSDAQTAAHDMIQVSGSATLDFSAINPGDPNDAAHRFTLRAISLQANGTPGVALGFAPNQSYSWNIFSYNNLDALFDPTKILIDPTLFSTNLGTGFAIGTFSVTDAGGLIALNLTTFAGIPEPSTYALLALGLGCLSLTAWRRARLRA